MQTFKQVALSKAAADPKHSKGKLGKGLARIEALPDGPVKTMIWKIAESHVRAKLGIPRNKKVDWAKVNATDWASILDFFLNVILPILLALLPLLLATEKTPRSRRSAGRA